MSTAPIAEITFTAVMWTATETHSPPAVENEGGMIGASSPASTAPSVYPRGSPV